MKKNDDKKVKKVLEKFEEAKLSPFLHKCHALPETRREFMAHGFIGVSSTFVLPTFLTMLASSNNAFSQSVACELPQFSPGLPYICLDASGGMNIAGSNVLVGMTAEGEHQEDYGPTTSDYVRLGVSIAEHPKLVGKVESKYGLKFHRTSGVLEGMKSILDGETMPNNRPIEDGIDGLIFCTRTADDTQTNPINTVFMANKSGAQGELVQLVGTEATDTGARSAAPSGEVNLGLRPSTVRTFQDSENLLSVGGTLSSSEFLNLSNPGGQERIQKFMDRISNMNKSKVVDLSKQTSMDQIKTVLNCSSENAKTLFQTYTAAQLNPINDPAVMQVFNGASERVASVAKLVLDSIAGAGTITIGGADYHGRGSILSHTKDVEIGMAIGRCILLAKEKGKNLAIHLYTDGGVAGDAGGVSEPVTVLGIGAVEKIRWSGDSGTRSSAMLIFYKHDHDGSSLVKENSSGPRRQIGNFLLNGGVDLSTVIGNSTDNLWKAIMLNYLAAQGREGEFEDIFGRGSLPSEYESLIRMKPFA